MTFIRLAELRSLLTFLTFCEAHLCRKIKCREIKSNRRILKSRIGANRILRRNWGIRENTSWKGERVPEDQGASVSRNPWPRRFFAMFSVCYVTANCALISVCISRCRASSYTSCHRNESRKSSLASHLAINGVPASRGAK